MFTAPTTSVRGQTRFGWAPTSARCEAGRGSGLRGARHHRSARETWPAPLDLAPVEIAPVEARHGFLRLLGRRHLDEAEAPRPAGPGVGHDRRGLDDPGGGEDLAQTLTGDGEREAADEQFVRHYVSPCHIFR